jgi:hypothetical protein
MSHYFVLSVKKRSYYFFLRGWRIRRYKHGFYRFLGGGVIVFCFVSSHSRVASSVFAVRLLRYGLSATVVYVGLRASQGFWETTVDDFLTNLEVISEHISFFLRFLQYEFKIKRGRPGSSYPTGGEAIGPSLLELPPLVEVSGVLLVLLTKQPDKDYPFVSSTQGAGLTQKLCQHMDLL